jgi:ElaB/YqjD/DUF883 family membrane-anchored ribosome-binding protein
LSRLFIHKSIKGCRVAYTTCCDGIEELTWQLQNVEMSFACSVAAHLRHNATDMSIGRGILCAAIQVAKGTEPHLVKSMCSSRVTQHALKLLAEPLQRNDKRSYSQDKTTYSVLSDSDMNRFIVVTPDEFDRRATFEFLTEVKNKFALFKSDLARLDEELSRIINKYTDPSANKIAEVKRQLDEAKREMAANIDLALERGDRIEDNAAATKTLLDQTDEFSRNANKLKWQMRKKRIICVIAIIVALLLIGFILSIVFCREPGDGASGIFNWNKCKSKFS